MWSPGSPNHSDDHHDDDDQDDPCRRNADGSLSQPEPGIGTVTGIAPLRWSAYPVLVVVEAAHTQQVGLAPSAVENGSRPAAPTSSNSRCTAGGPGRISSVGVPFSRQRLSSPTNIANPVESRNDSRLRSITSRPGGACSSSSSASFTRPPVATSSSPTSVSTTSSSFRDIWIDNRSGTKPVSLAGCTGSSPGCSRVFRVGDTFPLLPQGLVLCVECGNRSRAGELVSNLALGPQRARPTNLGGSRVRNATWRARPGASRTRAGWCIVVALWVMGLPACRT